MSGGSEHEVNRRISISCNCMQMLDRHIWRSMISLSTKLRLYNVYILPVFLYGAETWSITKAIEKRIDAFDQWCLRRILNITWSERVTNFEVRIGVLDSQCCQILCGPDASSCLATWPGPTSHKIIPALYEPVYYIASSKELEAASRPSKTYLAIRTVEEDLRQFNLGLASGLRRAQNRTTWRTLTGTASHRQAPID